jgi:lecithin-cholesterol acyltransferase
MGGFFIHYLLSNLTTPEWRAKYIDSAILIAPSFGGSGLAFASIWTQEIVFLPFLGKFPDLMAFWGALDIHALNFEVFQNTVIYRGEDGSLVTAPHARELLQEHGKLPNDSDKIFDKYIPFFQTAPGPLDVPVAIVYNTKIQTIIGIDDTPGNDGFLYGGGDLMVNSAGPEWACRWKSPKPVECLDLHSDELLTNHLTMLWNPITIDFVISHATNSSWHRHFSSNL